MSGNNYVYSFTEIDRTSLASVGGKGANLGELCRIPGIAVPAGFCVTTRAYRDFVNTSEEFTALLETLASIDVEALEELRAVGKRIRIHLENLDIPAPIRQEISRAWRETGNQYAYAVRSSATAEDLPGAFFAGQQDTYLNIKGEQNILESVRKCWASLFTDRAIVYRQRNGFRHEQVLLAVVVQRMVYPDVSGIMFTADPVTSKRRIVSIDASFGLGEALVSGIVSADLYQVKSGKVIKKQISKKETAVYARPEGGTAQMEIPGERQTAPALTEEQAVRLAGMGRSIEEHFGTPQDIEWCLKDNEIFIVQSRPVTTLYPVPEAADDKLHLFVSVGHVQMMTGAMKPLGISVLRTLVPFGKGSPGAESDLLQEAGGRLYLDITRLLEYSQLRKRLPELLLNVDESIGRAVQEFIGRKDFLTAVQPGKKLDFVQVKKVFPTVSAVLRNILYRDNYQVADEINRFISEKVAENRARLQEVSGADRITRIQEILPTLMPEFVSRAAQYMVPAIVTYKLIERFSKKWLGDAAQLGSISKSPPGNVTTEMGLALGDVRYYTPGIMLLSILVYLLTRDIEIALTLLVIACPGALVIATPVSIVSAIGNGARKGVLLKGGEHLEKAGKVNVVAFDKTGTLTYGRPSVKEIKAFVGTESQVIAKAASVEINSEHHLARAIVKIAGDNITPAEDFLVHPGMGASGLISGTRIIVGNRALIMEAGINMPEKVESYLQQQEIKGHTAIIIAEDNQIIGVVSIADQVRTDAVEVVSRLKKTGIKVIMLTGDNPRTAATVANELGIEEFKAGLLPEQKLTVINEYKQKGHIVAMVGDGINDTPALATADVGVAMGAAGTDVAVEVADVILMADKLHMVPYAIGLSRATLINIKQNITFAIAVVLLLVAGVLGKYVFLASGMLVHQASVMLVILNAMRLLSYKPKYK